MISRNGSRRRYAAKEKVKILEEGRQSGAVSETCRRHGISTAQFYQWEKQAREAMLERFGETKRGSKSKDRRVEALEGENTRLKDVIAEITAENLDMKKTSSGEGSERDAGGNEARDAEDSERNSGTKRLDGGSRLEALGPCALGVLRLAWAERPPGGSRAAGLSLGASVVGGD